MVPSIMAESWLWDSQIVVKKNRVKRPYVAKRGIKNHSVVLRHKTLKIQYLTFTKKK